MRLRHIEVFRAVMLTGSASAAARLLSVSQPVVSRVLQHAELGLGFALFERARGRLLPTAEARALFAQVQRAWGEIERVEALAANLRRGASGLLRVAATPSLATSLLPDALAAMRDAHPQVECDLWASHTREIEAHLLSWEVDAGFAIEAPEHVAITVSALCAGEMVLAAPRPWSSGVLRPGRRAWLGGRPFIALAEATPLGERLAARLAAAQWSPRQVLRVQTYALAGTLVERGLGYAFLDGYTAAALDPARVVLMRTAPVLPFTLSMMSAAGSVPSVLVGRLRDCLLHAAQRSAASLAGRLDSQALEFDA
ncbi:LysR family transcriptional regulator [Pseudothauera lacus]|uniref:LysR family transcriptional regulator n=1 Tax=Pseudothauera lacus TaxID=2136175 RepID=A0A2T4IB12_9RHOO|nr:LysR substrate-binding domain-containing protein [Pseudothauera lacus]PTD94959.1 LysR family transcriptional regulator [Pseudothauera lacus]